eukprot:13193289-Heterocapsa_arctica.AAC.1
MGYAWLSHSTKEHDLQEFPEFANFVENGLMQRTTTEDEEEQEEIYGNDGSILDENKKGAMTEDMVKTIVTMVAANVMTE